MAENTDKVQANTPEETVAKEAVVEAVESNPIEDISFDKYAIFETGGKQYQAIEGKTIAIEKLEGEAGDAIEFKDVLFRKLDADNIQIGQPLLEGSIKATIVKHDKDKKVVIFKFKRRKKSRVKTGHRQPLTVVRIEKI
ncbi:MAG TPA: 50S ribosomal protein L21 [Candidatus Babeliales bacterium]|nr:50S ribosomal protein L21 [Candidatus Babeliales bacterium]